MQDAGQRPALTSGIMGAQDGAARAPATHARAAVTAGASSSSQLLSSRCVISLDLDCFYAQCEELRRPELKGKPLGVQQKMLVITSNYAARAYGIKKGDSLHAVRQKCPHITIVSGEDLTFYRHVSQRVFDVVSAWSPAVERLGMDELFVDLTAAVDRRMQEEEERAASSAGTVDFSDGERSSVRLTPCGFLYPSPSPASEADAVRLRYDGRTLCCEDPLSVCAARLAMCSLITEEVRADVHRTLGLTTSAGISVSKLLAKLVASAHKPHCQTILLPTASNLDALLPASLPISSIPGIGFASTRLWNAEGVHTVDDLLSATEPGCALPRATSTARSAASRLDDKSVHAMRSLCLGICEQPVLRTGPPKSVSAEDSFWREPLRSMAQLEASVRSLSRQLTLKLRQDERVYGCRQPSTIAVTVRHHAGMSGDGGGERERKRTRQEKLGPANLLGRPPPSAFDPNVPPSLTDTDETTVAELARRALAIFATLVPQAAFDLDIFNIALRFDSGTTALSRDSAQSIGSCFRAAAATTSTADPASAPVAAIGPAGTPDKAPSAVAASPLAPAARIGGGAGHGAQDGSQQFQWSVDAADVDPAVLDELPIGLQAEIRRGLWLARAGSSSSTTATPTVPPHEGQPARKRAKQADGSSSGQRTLDAFVRGARS